MSKITIDIAKDENGNRTFRDFVTIEDARIITEYNNFSGCHGFREDDTRKSVCVVIDDPDAIQFFEQSGWNLKTTANPQTGEETRYLQVRVSYRFYNPNDRNPVPTIVEKDPTSGKLTHYDEDTVSAIDSFRRKDGFEHCDIVFKGSPYEGQNGSGVTGYLQWMQFIPRYNAYEDTIERLSYADEEQQDANMPF